MARPDVNIVLENGALSGAELTGDGNSGIICSGVSVSGKLVLAEVYVLLSVEDLTALGIDADYDDTNKVLVYTHVSDFYSNAPAGTKLYLMVVADTVTMANMADKTLTYAKKMLEYANGDIKMLALTRVPSSSYTPLVTSGFDDDSKTAAINAQALVVDEFSKHRPLRVLIEGRAFQGNAATVLNHRSSATSLRLNAVAMVISANNDVSIADAKYNYYANAGFLLGVLASIKVSRNIGRVKSGALSITNLGLSSGELIETYTDAQLTALHDAGYILAWSIPQLSGYYFSDDPTLTVSTDDYNSLSRGRVIDKAARLIRQAYVYELLDDFEVVAGGTMDIGVIKYFESSAEDRILENMKRNGKDEISAVSVYVDPKQDVVTNEKWTAVLKVRPRGVNKDINVKLGYTI